MRRLTAIIVVLVAVAGWAYVVMNANTFVLFGTVTSRVETQERLVALTFDDGPTPAAREVGAMLREHGGHATFFAVGQDLAKQPDLAAALVADGHELGNHSWSHRRMLLLPRSRIAEEVERTDRLIRDAGQVGEILFRPPYGKKCSACRATSPITTVT